MKKKVLGQAQLRVVIVDKIQLVTGLTIDFLKQYTEHVGRQDMIRRLYKSLKPGGHDDVEHEDKDEQEHEQEEEAFASLSNNGNINPHCVMMVV